jgi:phosphoserine phosphatase
MDEMTTELKSNLLVLQINGPDRKGLFTKFCKYLLDQNVNIRDVSQTVMRGFLAITFLLDINESIINKDRLDLGLKKLARELDLSARIFDYKKGQRARVRDLYIFSSMGPDKPGILYRLSEILSNYNANIDTIKILTRSNWNYTQLILDLHHVQDIKALRDSLRKVCEELGLSVSLQHESLYYKNKKLIAFDMDSTLVKGETIVEIARKINKQDEMARLTELAMSTDQDFSTSLRERVKLLTGVSEKTLLEIAENLEIASGAEELIQNLKTMDWKIALISSGFSYFTDVIKKKLDLDYSFGNTLEIKNGIATGNVLGTIIDAEGKWKIIEDLMAELGITRDQVVTVGDGSNDRIMLQNSGLGIGFNSKEIASSVSDGRIQQSDAKMILLLLGLSQTEIDNILKI